MQYAKHTIDNKTWEASEFAALPVDELETKRRNLICVQCSGFAWFCKESTHGHPAHFKAHHKDCCELKVEYVVVGESRNEATIEENEVTAGSSIIVRLDQEQGSDIDVNEVQPPPSPGEGGGGRTFIKRGSERESFQHFTLRKILLRLVQSPTFCKSTQELVFYKNENEILLSGQVRNIVANFADIDPGAHDDKRMFFWGPIASAGKTPDGKLWLNSSDSNKGVSVVVFPDIVDDFLTTFRIDNLEELAGAHVLVAGKCNFSGTGKPIIWCGSSKYIVVRRYKDKRLQAVL